MRIYTAIFGKHDELKPLPEGMKGVCFSDGAMPAQGWEIRPPVFMDADPRKRSRHHKCMSHVLFPEEETLWIDGSIRLSRLPPSAELGAYLHRNIHSATEELHHITRCNRWPSEQDRVRGHQMIGQFIQLGYPDTERHIETGFLVRQDTPKVRQYNELWWSLIDKYSLRDQLSSGYARWKSQLKAFIYGPDMRRVHTVERHSIPMAESVYYFTPYDKRGVGVAYNECCKIVPSGAWICLMDADVMLFPSHFGDIVQEALRARPDIDIWTCMVTRVNNAEKIVCPQGRKSEERDLVKLKQASCHHSNMMRGKVSDFEFKSLAGYFLLFRKEFWEKHPFPERSGHRGIMGIDTEWSQKCHREGAKFGLIEGLLAVHYYSLGENRDAHIRELEGNVKKLLPRTENNLRQLQCKPLFGRGIKVLTEDQK